MIKAVLFDLGGTLHKSSTSPERDLWFCRRILDRLGDYGIHLDGGAELLARRLAVNSEIYKHESEKTLRELPAERIWSEYYLREYGLTAEELAPFAEELFTLKRGTCYRYASGFAYMAKIAGYRSRFCFGYSGVLQHGWTEVYVDGEWLICDVDAQLPTYPFDPYDVYMVRNHVWILDKYWHSELTVKNGKAEWGPIINY